MDRLAAVLLFTCAMPVAAQAAAPAPYPVNPVRLIVPYAPGGGTDLITRPLAQRLSAALGQQVVVDNRGGANGSIGMETAAKAPPDGYTLVLALTAQFAINPAFYRSLPYDPVKDYSPVALLGSAPYLLTINPGLPAKTLKELIALGKSASNPLAYGSSGTGGIPHLAGEMLASMTGMTLTHVPYKGGGPALIDVIAGQIQMNFAVIPVAMPHAKAGRVRAMGVTAAKRFSGAADVPAIAETLPGYEIATWYGVMAPARTPRAVIDTLNRALVDAFGDTKLRTSYVDNGFEPDVTDPAALGRHITAEMKRWAALVKSAGIKPE